MIAYSPEPNYRRRPDVGPSAEGPFDIRYVTPLNRANGADIFLRLPARRRRPLYNRYYFSGHNGTSVQGVRCPRELGPEPWPSLGQAGDRVGARTARG